MEMLSSYKQYDSVDEHRKESDGREEGMRWKRERELSA